MQLNLVCYRFYAWTTDYDIEQIWALVQRHGGRLHLGRDSVDFWIPQHYSMVLALAYPDLVREPSLDEQGVYHYFDPISGRRLPKTDPDYWPDPN
jgi:hypothetical protein